MVTGKVTEMVKDTSVDPCVVCTVGMNLTMTKIAKLHVRIGTKMQAKIWGLCRRSCSCRYPVAGGVPLEIQYRLQNHARRIHTLPNDHKHIDKCLYHYYNGCRKENF